MATIEFDESETIEFKDFARVDIRVGTEALDALRVFLPKGQLRPVELPVSVLV